MLIMSYIFFGIIFGISCSLLIFYILFKAELDAKLMSFEKLSKFWPNLSFTKEEYEEALKEIKQKRKIWLEKNIKLECFRCKTFDKTLSETFPCAIQNSCPGLNLRPWEKIEILNKTKNIKEEQVKEILNILFK